MILLLDACLVPGGALPPSPRSESAPDTETVLASLQHVTDMLLLVYNLLSSIVLLGSATRSVAEENVLRQLVDPLHAIARLKSAGRLGVTEGGDEVNIDELIRAATDLGLLLVSRGGASSSASPPATGSGPGSWAQLIGQVVAQQLSSPDPSSVAYGMHRLIQTLETDALPLKVCVIASPVPSDDDEVSLGA